MDSTNTPSLSTFLNYGKDSANGIDTVFTNLKDVEENQKILIEKQNILSENQMKIMKQLATMQTSIDLLCSKFQMMATKDNESPKSASNHLLLEPIDSLEELEDLNNNLANADVLEKMVRMIKLYRVSSFVGKQIIPEADFLETNIAFLICNFFYYFRFKI